MSHFICSISTDASGTPTAYALTERGPGRGEPSLSYHVHALNRLDGADLDGADLVEKIQDLLADEEQYAGRVTVVAMGGQRVADRFAKAGLSAVPVTVGDRGGDAALRTTEQTLVDTFQAVYRHRTVKMPNEREEVSAVLSALYNAMSDDAGADEASPEMEALAREETTGEVTEPIPEDGPKPDVPALSGSSAALSTAKIGGAPGDRTVTEDQAITATPHRGLEDSRNAGPVDLGEYRDLALALALSCWYGEYGSDDVPLTDQSDETARDARVRAKRRRKAQDKQNR